MEETERPFSELEETADDTVKSTDGDLLSSTTTQVSESDYKETTVKMDEREEQEITETTEDIEKKSTVDDLPTNSAPFPISGSCGSEGDSTSGPSTADNSQSIPSRGIVIKVQATEDIEIVPEKME
ncbi:uncharacterized protein LOC122569072 isoform X2 [Bombus pyrosoma]|uniref:uncharacterized protein LOC122569072 isoform X2 n=1 Tax=Bombus pyrosoma TaxID=396416 RepID=UPI001CB8C40B|nr:uncharacterized protein LOC122569072 isoform X2 [Bombus pyrosoma]